MEIIKRTNIVIKTARRFIVRRAETDEPLQCGQCARQMIRAQAAAQIFVVSSRTIYGLIEKGNIHFTETEVSEIYVCPTSIREALEIQLAETLAE
jgi:hypothetical protein